MDVEPIFVSLAFYGAVIIFCEISRQIVDRFTYPNTETRKFFYEVIATAQVCTCVYENGLVSKYYGIFPGFFFAVFTLLIAHSFMNRGALISPCVSVERVAFGTINIAAFLVFFAAQLLGGYLAFRAARQLWWVGLSVDHASQFSNFPCAVVHKVNVNSMSPSDRSKTKI